MSSRAETLWYVFVGFAIAALAVIVIAAAGPDNAPVEWLEYTSIDGVHCPGDVVPYSVVLRIDKAGPVYATSSIMRADDNAEVEANRQDPWAADWSAKTGLPIAGDTIKGQQLGDVFITVIDKAGVLFVDRDFSFTVPDLPPGKYVRNVAAGMYGVDGTTTIRSQPFTVGDNCAKD